MYMDELPLRRRRLVSVLQNAGSVIRVDDAVAALAVGRAEASKILSRWAKQGWLRRVHRGVYVPVDIARMDSDHVLTDPWILVPALYAPAYVGGWTAAAHWNLTEQMFATVAVMTAKPVRRRLDQRHGTRFALHRTRAGRMFGLRSIWCDGAKVRISDLHRTLVDMFDDPGAGGGIDQVADCFREYLDHPQRDDKRLIEYADAFGNGAVFKRLGFVAEQGGGGSAALADACRGRLTKGYARLDRRCPCPQPHAKWRIRAPRNWTGWSARGH